MKKVLVILLCATMLCMTSCSKPWKGLDDMGEYVHDFYDDSQDMLSVMDSVLAKFELNDRILNSRVSADSYMNLVFEENGEALTYEDLTSDIRVGTADMHHVSIVNGCTVIYLHFPNVKVTADMYQYYFDLEKECYPEVFSYWEGECGILYTPESGMMIYKGEDVISVAGDVEDGSVDEVLRAFGYPTMETLEDLFSRINED